MYLRKSDALLLIVVVVSLFVFGSTNALNNLCNKCECVYVGAIAKTVTCDCSVSDKKLNITQQEPNITQQKLNITQQELNITQQAMAGLEHIEHFSVANCFSVNFHKNSFGASHDLKTVSVSRVNHVTLPVGVFSSLNSLLVEDVEDLRLLEKALMAAKVFNITIHRTNISVLPTHSLYGIDGLKIFELMEVHIKEIKPNAIYSNMVAGSSFVVDSCEVDHIDTNAIMLETELLSIVNSKFQNVSDNAANGIVQSVDIETTFFGPGCSEQGFILKSEDIRIINNTFNTLPIGLLTTLDNSESSITFTENNVFTFSLESLNTAMNLDVFSNNEVICDCILAVAIPTFSALNSVNTMQITEHNFCYLESGCQISLNAFAKKNPCNNVNSIDKNFVEDMCKNQPSTTTIYTPTIATTQRRSPRQRMTGVSNSHPVFNQSTTTATPSLKTDEIPTMIASGRTASAGRINIVDRIIIFFMLVTCSTKYIFG